ncbi:MAG TPA: winged helix-turn-helix domain-containing protein, partial [Terrimesophilobacter sp.]|nr:winged helix-turn-helix domain-containing protein [Terrimesophilobacter sp.]
MVEKLSAGAARRVALAAQGFGRPRASVGTRQLNLLLRRLGVLQIDSV